MARVQKKPVIVDAALFDGERVGDVIGYHEGLARVLVDSCPDWFPAVVREVTDKERAKSELREGEVVRYGNLLLLGTLEGANEASPGDWIIRGVNGEIYPCKPDIFAKTYDRLDG